MVESNEYGYESLIKAVNQVLDKLNLENRTLTEITAKQRKEQRLWNAVALRESVINSMVHNDYTRETAPKFEIFDDRIEITSNGGIPHGLQQHEFFQGYTVPRNKELMRIFKDLDFVEQLGSGIPRILEAYGTEVFNFSENFLRIILPSTAQPIPSPQVTPQVTPQDTPQVEELLKVFSGTHSRIELQQKIKLLDRENFRKNYLQPAINAGLVELTIPDKPTSRNQRYYLSEKGIDWLEINKQ